MKIIKIAKEFCALVKYWRRHPLASHDLLGTILRFFRWQMGSRLLNVPVVWPWIGGSRLVVERGMAGATMNMYCGLHEFEDMSFVLHLLRPGDKFVDIGANVGSYTVLAGKVVGASVISIEPVPSTYCKLVSNIEINGIAGSVQALQNGVGPVDGAMLNFTADSDTTNQVASSDYRGEIVAVPIRSLDNLLSGYEAIMWKMDVEGFEEAALSGALSVLSKPSLWAVQLEGESSVIEMIMKGAGFSRYDYDPITRILKKSSGGRNSHNWLWIKNETAVADRCRKGDSFHILGVTI